MDKFIIVTPRYLANSNGIKTLHKICHTINNNGGWARLVFIKSNDPNCQETTFSPDCTELVTSQEIWTHPAYNTPTLSESEKNVIEEAYVLYPEIIAGNPLDAKKIIRYFGNREGFCNKKMIDIGPTDFLVAHSIVIRRNAHYILFNSEVNPLFHNNGTAPTLQRTLDVTYVGKGFLYGDVGLVENSILVARDWPPEQKQFATLLRSTRCMYTWDSWTSANVEAILCGAVPFFLRYDPWISEDLDQTELGHIPRMDNANPKFDEMAFMAARQALIEKINYLADSWDDRVREFTTKVHQHFADVEKERLSA